MKSSQNSPLVSVCIPTYNGAAFLNEALHSVSQQTYLNLEIIISDDASTDGTLKIIDHYKKHSKFSVHVYHHDPCGIAENWNHCLRYSNGKYIKFLFQDDILKPECIERMVAVLESDQKIALVASKRDIITNLNNRFSDGWIRNFDNLQIHLNLPDHEVAILHGRDLMKAPHFKKKPINIIGEPVAVLFRKDLIDVIGYFDTKMFQLVDYEYWLRMFKSHSIAFIPEHLVQFRLHDAQASYLNKQSELNDQDMYYRLLYNRYFWYLHPNFKWILLKRYHPMFKLLIKIKRYFVFNLTL